MLHVKPNEKERKDVYSGESSHLKNLVHNFQNFKNHIVETLGQTRVHWRACQKHSG